MFDREKLVQVHELNIYPHISSITREIEKYYYWCTVTSKALVSNVSFSPLRLYNFFSCRCNSLRTDKNNGTCRGRKHLLLQIVFDRYKNNRQFPLTWFSQLYSKQSIVSSLQWMVSENNWFKYLISYVIFILASLHSFFSKYGTWLNSISMWTSYFLA